MNLFFDEESQRLITNAKEEMYKLKHPYVGSEHLLLAILNNKSLEITKMLNKYGINYSNFKDELINVVGIGKKSNDWFLFTPLLKRIINNATYYSKSNNKVVTPYNLFISILQEGDGIANRILIGMNFDINALYEKFLTPTMNNTSVETPLLDELGINMNKKSLAGKYDPVFGRNREIDQVIQILLRKNKNNPLLIGEAGVGKTAIVEELAKKITLGDVPLKLKNKVLYSISMSSLVAGTKYRGEFEEKINKLLNEVNNNPNIILFIDEVHTIMGAGGAEGAIDASNIVKPYLARGDIRVIGATTTFEYSKFISKDKALDRRFQKIYVEEANNEMIKNILLGLKPIYENYHNVVIEDKLIDYIIDISNNCIFNGRQPDKAIDLLDEVCSFGLLHNNKLDSILSKYELKIKDYENKKNTEIINHNFKKALIYKDREMKYRSEYNDKLFNSNINKAIILNSSNLENVIYNKFLIPKNIDKEYVALNLKKSIYGQDNIIENVVNSLCKYDFIDNKKPLIYLFVGKSGVGKTFLVEKIVKELYSSINFISINTKEYLNESSLSKLLGSSLGYVGYEDGGMFDSIKTHPFSIILIDNIDMAKAYFLNLFIEAFEKGYILNSHGDKINLSKCIIFMTSRKNNNEIGFVGNKVSNNDYNGIIDYTFIFNDISKDILSSYIKDKYNNYSSKDINNKIKYVLDNSNYATDGFRKVISICNNKI